MSASITLGLVLAVGPLAVAQTTAVNRTDRISTKVTIQSIDAATRHMVVTNPEGDHIPIKVPPAVHNFDQLKVGDTIAVTYKISTELVVAGPDGKLPPDAQTIAAARVEKGEEPGGAVANTIVVTGAVLGIDMAKHTLKIVSPQGGEVYNVAVTRADGQKAMAKLKVGDKITAYITESLLLSVNKS
jgi:hypothetical protein